MIFTLEIMEPLFVTLEQCRGIAQMNNHHPEGCVFTHSVQVLYWALKESNDTDLILAAMLHDVGKMENSHGHEKIAVGMLKPYLSAKSLWLIEQHMRVWYLLLGEMRKLSKVKHLVGHPWLPELIHLVRWDKMGRNPMHKPYYDREAIMERLNKCVERRFACH
jgi:HD domain-containing protein